MRATRSPALPGEQRVHLRQRREPLSPAAIHRGCEETSHPDDRREHYAVRAAVVAALQDAPRAVIRDQVRTELQPARERVVHRGAKGEVRFELERKLRDR